MGDKVDGCGLRVAGVRVVGYELRVTSYGVRVVGCRLLDTGGDLRVSGCGFYGMTNDE